MSLSRFNRGNKYTTSTEGLKFKKLEEAGEGARLKVLGFFFTEGKFGKAPVMISEDAIYNLPDYMSEQVKEIDADEEAVAAINAGTEFCIVEKFHCDKFNKDSYKIVFE